MGDVHDYIIAEYRHIAINVGKITIGGVGMCSKYPLSLAQTIVPNTRVRPIAVPTRIDSPAAASSTLKLQYRLIAPIPAKPPPISILIDAAGPPSTPSTSPNMLLFIPMGSLFFIIATRTKTDPTICIARVCSILCPDNWGLFMIRATVVLLSIIFPRGYDARII